MKCLAFVKNLILFVLFIALAISCSKNEPESQELENNTYDKLELADGTDLDLTLEASGGTITISFNATTAWVAKIGSNSAAGWCSVSPSKGNAGTAYITVSAKENKADGNRSTSIVITAGTAKQTVKITQLGIDEQVRASLIEFYKLTDGDNWLNNQNWCSDKPVSDWYGVIPDINGHVTSLVLTKNRLAGSLPDCMEYLLNIPTLSGVNLSNNYLTGSLSKVLSKLGGNPYLNSLALQYNLLTGTIPESLVNIRDLYIDISWNLLSGTITGSVLKSDLWIYTWERLVRGNRFEGLDKLRWDAPKFKALSIRDGRTIDLEQEYKRHKYTILYYFTNFVHAQDEALWPQLKHIYENYPESYVKIIGHTNLQQIDALSTYNGYGWEWDAFSTAQVEGNSLPYEPMAVCSVVNNEGKVIYSICFELEEYSHSSKRLINLLENDFKLEDDSSPKDLYESVNFSYDGKVEIIQRSTKGNGIDIVLMGDGYSDRLIEDGTYLRTMKTACDKLFEKEPYKTFREYFNVYCVYAVSKNEVCCESSSTVFDCNIKEHSTHISGDNRLAMAYASNAIGFNKIENASIIVILNNTQYAGTCYMNVPSSENKDWAEGTTISYVPICENDEFFGSTIQHEVCGHGFAKLADEYVEFEEEISPHNKEHTIKEVNLYGWWKNIDFTGDPTQVKWAKFLQDSRYADQGLGVFEGANTFSKGVWKPTENSIMLDNTGYFNAPSREAIYYRIHKLAYGPEWVYDYEKFVEYDAINRNMQASSRVSQVPSLQTKAHLHSPKVININLNEVKREATARKSLLKHLE